MPEAGEPLAVAASVGAAVQRWRQLCEARQPAAMTGAGGYTAGGIDASVCTVTSGDRCVRLMK